MKTMKIDECPYEIDREVSRFEWGMERYPIKLKAVSFRLNPSRLRLTASESPRLSPGATNKLKAKEYDTKRITSDGRQPPQATPR